MPFIHNAYRWARESSASFIAFANRVGWWKVALAAGAIFLMILFGAKFLFGGSAPEKNDQAPRLVEVRSVAELTAQTTPLSIVGTISATSEADVRAETSGQVTGVYRALGDYVSAGAVVAELENASQRASVLQAQGAVDAAQAAVDKITGGTRAEQLSILQSATDAARSASVNAILSSYAAIDSAVRIATDALFTDPEGSSPNFNVWTSNSQVTLNAESKRLSLSTVLAREKQKSSTLSKTDDLSSELSKTEMELRQTREYLDTVIAALNNGIASPSYSQTTIDTYVASANTARTSITTALSTISAAKQGLETTEKSQEQGVSGAQSQDVAAAQAVLKQAQGGLAAARAQLEKTIIRSPISGTINAFSLKRGEYVSITSPVLTVANNGALEVTAYVTQQDVRDIAIGDTVEVDDGAGIVTRISPALDPVTKRIEVRIGISRSTNLVNGQSVIVKFVRKSLIGKPQKNTPLSIPIAALRVGASDMSVFLVSASSTLESQIVQIGTLLGDRVEIRAGLTPDMRIVTDARGLRSGQVVDVK